MALKNYCVFLILISGVYSIQNKYCYLSCDFVIKQFTHTVCDRGDDLCGPHERCGPNFKILSLTDDDRQYILDLHNELRNLVALGNETRGDQPPASNMNVLSYNKELELIAQCWANTCNGHPLIHDNCRRTSEYEHVGQNLGVTNSSLPDVDVQATMTELTMLWYDEARIFNNDWINDTRDRGPNFKVGHYTQMMWANTLEIGCALSYYTTVSNHRIWYHTVYVCNYGPGGNYLGIPVYDVGEPASSCSDNKGANEEYVGLCGETKKVGEEDDKLDFLDLSNV